MSNELLDQVIEIAKPQLEALVEQTKTNFMATFGDFVESAHKDRLAQLFKEAGEAKIKALLAKDSAKAAEWQDIYATKIASIETLGLAVKIVGAAKSRSFLMETAKQVLDTLGGVAATVLKTIVAGFVQGAIAGVTGGAAPAIGGGIAALAQGFLNK